MIRTPKFWYSRPGFLAWTLFPLGWLYAKATAWRINKSKIISPESCPVICIGNIHAGEVLVLNIVDNVIIKGKKISVFGSKVSYDVFFELKEGGVIRFYDKGSGFDISDDAILKLENGKEFFLDDLKTKKLIGFGGQDMTYEFLDKLEESSGVIPSNWTSKLSGLFKKK